MILTFILFAVLFGLVIAAMANDYDTQSQFTVTGKRFHGRGRRYTDPDEWSRDIRLRKTLPGDYLYIGD